MNKFLTNGRNFLTVSIPALAGLATTSVAFASEAPGTPSVAITTEMLAPITDAITANIGVILPVGIAIFGILLGVGLVPYLIKKFSKG